MVENESLARILHENCSCAEMFARLDAISPRLAAQINERTGRETIAPDRVRPEGQLLDGFMLKPMNCPHHIKIFSSQPHSYRDLPCGCPSSARCTAGAVGRAQRDDPRARFHTGRRPPLLHREQVPGELLGCLTLVKTVLATSA